MAGGSIYGSPFLFVHAGGVREDLIFMPILIFACFWCACAASGTVRAATWAMPAIAAVPFATAGGLWLGRQFANSTGTLKDLVVSSFHLSPLAYANFIDYADTHVLWLFVPTLVAALLQSHRLFRTPPQNSALWMLRCLVPLVGVTLLWSFFASAVFLPSHWEPFQEAGRALDKFYLATGKLELTGEDLARSSSFNPLTLRWLRGSSIVVAPTQSHLPGYVAAIHLASGLECKLTVIHSGGTAASCGKP